MECSAQEKQSGATVRLVFYNTENFFDPFDDSLTQDEEFLPGGPRNWNWERYLEKEKRIYKVLAAAGGWDPPGLIGLCEIENRFVLNRLCFHTPLMKYGYRIIHYESPDERGIDLGLMYRETVFQPLEQACFPAGLPEDPTRDILYVRGTVLHRDTLHLILCHFPSRWRGYAETVQARMHAARVVMRLIDSIRAGGKPSRIILAGDLNDELSDPAISGVLDIRHPDPGAPPLFSDSLMYQTGSRGEGSGTLRYRGRWFEFDHIFASGFILRDTCLFVEPGGKRVFAPPFLLEKDPQYPGERPYRTYSGFRYKGGFSDHLPVYIDIHSGCR